MADENADVAEENNEITPEQFDGEQDTDKAESSPAKQEATPAKETKAPKAEVKEKPEVIEKPKEEAKADPEAKDAETDGKSEEAEETDAKPQGKAEERKSQLNTEIRDLVSKRNALKDEVEKTNSEVYQPASEDDLKDQGMSELEAKVEAMRQQGEMDKYNTQVAEAQLTIESEAQRVLQDFSMFNPDSNDYDKELADEAAELLQGNLIVDPNTQQIIGSNVSPYSIYRTLAKASGISGAKGQIKGQEDTEKMLASADNGNSTAPAKKTANPLEKLWEGEL